MYYAPTGSYFPASRPTGAYFPYQSSAAPLGQQLTDIRPLVTTAALLWIAVRFGGGVVAGRAMAPKPDDKMTWGIIGGVLGAIGGPGALGLLGVVSLEARD